MPPFVLLLWYHQKYIGIREIDRYAVVKVIQDDRP